MSFSVVALVTILLLVACERPDPSMVAAAAPVLLPSPTTTPEPEATPEPVQVNVTIIMPTSAAGQQLLPGIMQVVVVSPTPEPTEVEAMDTVAIEPTPYPANFYMGWAWSDSLAAKENDRLFVSSKGAQLTDRPSPDGNRIGLVVGLAEVVVVGQSYCGYTPVMAHLGNMLTMTTPRPDVIQPAALAAQQPQQAPLFAVQQGTTSGWAHLGSLVIMDNSVVPGQFGITLRQEPCKYAVNLGFVPADGLMDITGPPSGEYVPVRVSNDVIQLPLGTERPFELDPSANPGSLSVPTRQPPVFP